MSTRIPADVDTPDRVLGGLTVRQVAILAGTASLLWGLWSALQAVVAGWVFALGALPVVVVSVALALVRRDGLGLDRLAVLGMRFRLGSRRLHRDHPDAQEAEGAWQVPGWVLDHAADHHDSDEARPGRGPEVSGWDTRLPRGGRAGLLRVGAFGVHEHGWGGLRVGVVDLGSGGVAVLASCSTVNLALRHDTERAALLESFARLLASSGGGVQIVVRTQPLDLSGAIAALDEAIPTLHPPALAVAAAGHRDYLAALAATKPLTRHVLLVLREPVPKASDPRPDHDEEPDGYGRGYHDPYDDPEPGRDAALARLLGRLGEAQRCLAPAEITVRPLDAHATTAALAAAADPDRPLDDLATAPAPLGPPRATRHPNQNFGASACGMGWAA
jgi:hypothetical protein